MKRTDLLLLELLIKKLNCIRLVLVLMLNDIIPCELIDHIDENLKLGKL